MSGFDWKLPSNLQADKDKDRNEHMKALGDSKHPNHHSAKQKAHDSKMKRIDFWKNSRAKMLEKYKANGGKVAESPTHKVLDNHK